MTRALAHMKECVKNPFMWAVLLWGGLFVTSQFWQVIPGPYRAPDAADIETKLTAATNRIAAFEVNTAALLLQIVLILAYVAVVHPSTNLKQVAAKAMIGLTLFLQFWELLNRGGCKMANNAIALAAVPGAESMRGLCASTGMGGVVTVQIIFGMGMGSLIIWTYLDSIRKNGAG